MKEEIIIKKCAICGEFMPSHIAYVMHMELLHKPETIQPKRGKFLTKQEKAEIVAKGEARLGLCHFLGFGA